MADSFEKIEEILREAQEKKEKKIAVLKEKIFEGTVSNLPAAKLDVLMKIVRRANFEIYVDGLPLDARIEKFHKDEKNAREKKEGLPGIDSPAPSRESPQLFRQNY